MTRTGLLGIATALLLTLAALGQSPTVALGQEFKLQRGDHVCYIGNTLADRMQHHGWLETYLHALHPQHDLTFRNLGFPGDELKRRPRSKDFGSPDQWLTKEQADVVFCFFGYSEALRGEAALPGFEGDLAGMIDAMRQQKYNGKSAPRLVVFSPIAHENLNNPNLPDGSENNKKLAAYTAAMQKVCKAKGVTFVDLFTLTQALYKPGHQPLTMNGIHLLDRGNQAVANLILTSLLGDAGKVTTSVKEIARLREAVLDKNLHWFSRYRVVDGYNVYGGRSKLAWHKQSNADVMRREMEIFDVMTANRDKRIWAVAQGGDLKIKDKNLPPLLFVKTNKPGKLAGGAYAYLGGKEAIGRMTMAKGMQVNLFASEEMFPEMVNPVQMAVDTDGRLFASVWPSYPHWNPTQPRTDRIVCLPDENGDGVADKCVIFADKLNSITGFEFWGGGMLVAAPPEIWFLKDTDGDGKADFKLRMLQGLSSADTHHTANGLVIGTDGALYWSRGVFHVTNMETPTKTFRSTSSGVYRFDPRTFEISFHFPIGPNPHGDVIDQWGYQFVNDGTGGTGCYVSIGKGVRTKQWFRKRVRPVAATGILNSRHFPEENNNNFLICNTIGVLGILQHKVKYNGAEITAEEVEPILLSTDPNFRPTDIEIGGDGALYVSDWSNALIGHMQHNMRDPNRDHAHGRIYRITYKGRPLVTPVKMRGKPIETVLQAFFEKEKSTRYRAKLELSGRDTKDVVAITAKWAAGLDPSKTDEAQALLECLWVFEEHRVPNLDMVARLQKSEDGRVRAAAIRTLGHWAPKVGSDGEALMVAASRDSSGLVRAEAVKAAVEFQGLAATEVIFEVATRQTDPELDFVLRYARGKIDVDQVVQDAVKSGRALSSAAQLYVLRNASVADLLKMKRTEAVYRAILSRRNVPIEQLREALGGLAKAQKSSQMALLLGLIEQADAKGDESKLSSLSDLLSAQSAADLRSASTVAKRLARAGKTSATRRLGYATWIAGSGSAEAALAAASKSKESLRELLEAIPMIASDEVRSGLYASLRPLLSTLPSNLAQESGGGALESRGIKVDYFYPHTTTNVAIETLAKKKPLVSGVLPEIKLEVPKGKSRDGFALRFSGAIRIEKTGRYTFYTASDDGSRLYIGGKLVVNNDGNHGMVEKNGRLRLSAGLHPIVVTYYDNGGADGLLVRYSGPGISKQRIPSSKLVITGSDTLHDVAIRTLDVIPGHEADKFSDLAALVKANKHRTSAVRGLLNIPADARPNSEIGSLAESLAGQIAEIPAQYRTSKAALEAMQLVDSLAAALSPEETKRYQVKIAGLKIHVIRMGTVPHRMIFDKERIAIQAGKPVEFIFSNTDNMPHNFAIVQPGSLEEVGLLAEATARDPDAMARQYIPKSDKIMLASRLLQTGEIQALSFVAPKEPGIYPYVCTYPGHWRRMYGALYVVADLKSYTQDREKYLAANPLRLRDELLKYNERNTEWVFDDLLPSVKEMKHDRVFEVGKSVFKAASCVACHRMNKEGQEFGPDLAKLDAKKFTPEHILLTILEPSKEINEKFQSWTFALTNGKVITGIILEETPKQYKIMVDPVAKAEPTIIDKDDVELKKKSPTSIMPKGLASRLTREEILDLIAYIYSRGDQKHMLFEGHDHKK